MVTKTRVTLAEYLALEETKPYLELMDGEVIEKPMPGQVHGILVTELIFQLKTFERDEGGVTVVTEVRHLQREDEWVFLPDISVTLKSRLRPPAEMHGPVQVMPDFAIEVLSPDDKPGRVNQRVAHYMASGVRLLWVIDPDSESLTAWEPGATPRVVRSPQTVSAAPVLPGFAVDLGELFATLHRA